MKGLFSAAAGFLVIMLLTGCRLNPSLARSNFSYSGKFREYQTFEFLNIKSTGLDAYQSDMIKTTIFRRFSSLGYRYEPGHADLMIAFRYLQEEAVISGFRQSGMGTWMAERDISQNNMSYDRHKVRLPAGSLLVLLVDAKTGTTVWLGYSSLLDLNLHERNIMSSVCMILDNYKVTRSH